MMIGFYSLKEALGYRDKCPLCKKEAIQINDKNFIMTNHNYDSVMDRYKRTVTFNVDQVGKQTLTMDLETGQVEMYKEESSIDDAIFGLPNHLIKSFNPSYQGRFLHAMHLDCRSCCSYGYTLQLHFDLTKALLIDTFLNSEYMNIEDGPSVHLIKNIYSSSETLYSQVDKTATSKSITLPMIPLNVENPKETVYRIRKLLPFS